jgi:hypothetical protein
MSLWRSRRTHVAPALLEVVRGQTSRPATAGVRALTERLRERYGAALQAVLVYGSCFRGGDDREGLVDLYVLVDRYRAVHQGRARALVNKILPPAVYAMTVASPVGTVRAKYAILSLEDFRHCVSTGTYQSYFWARFAQPTGLVYARTPAVADEVLAGLACAVTTLLARALPQVPAQFDAASVWHEGLRLSYATEIRTEGPERILHLVEADADYYERATAAAVGALPFAVEMIEGPPRRRYRAHAGRWHRRVSALAWRGRRWQGKVLSVLRLLNALWTFEGGVAYALWKIERHTGIAAEAAPGAHRHPLLAGWRLAWRLYRQRAFR